MVKRWITQRFRFFKWSLGYKKTIQKTGDTFPLSWPETETYDNLKKFIVFFNSNPADYLLRFITMDETWKHFNSPDIKNLSRRRSGWMYLPKKGWRPFFKMNAEKSTTIQRLSPKGKTISKKYYANLLNQFNDGLNKIHHISRRPKCCSTKPM